MAAIHKRKVQRRNAVGGDTTVLKTVHFYVSGAQTTGSKFKFVLPEAGTYVGCELHLGTVNTGATLFVGDVHKNGTTLYTTQTRRPTIADGAASKKSTETATADITTLAAGDVLEYQTDTVGSTVAGSDLSIAIKYLARVSA